MSTYLLTYCIALGLILSPGILAQAATETAKATAGINKSAEPGKKKSDSGTVETEKNPGKGSTGKKPADTKPADTKPADKKSSGVSNAGQTLVVHAEKESANLTDAQSKKLLDVLNTGDDVAIEAIPGVGEVKAKALKQARPFRSVVSLIMVEGIGEVTFDAIIKWTKDGMPETATAKPTPKAAEKPAASAKDTKKPAKETAPPKPAEKKG
jgi:DNA uptake protein ComE-like DNA-binding protein